MIRRIIFIAAIFSAGHAGCVCEPQIFNSFQTLDKEIVENNLEPIKDGLQAHAAEIRKTTAELRKLTPEYQILLKQEADLALKLQEQLFELKKQTAIEANRNKIIAADVEAILKQNENLTVYEKRLMEKERY